MTEITGSARYHFRESYLGKSHCVEKVLPKIPKCRHHGPVSSSSVFSKIRKL